MWGRWLCALVALSGASLGSGLFCWDYAWRKEAPGWPVFDNHVALIVAPASPCEACARRSSWAARASYQGNRTNQQGYCPAKCRQRTVLFPAVTTPNVSGSNTLERLPDETLECCGRDFCNGPFMQEYHDGNYHKMKFMADMRNTYRHRNTTKNTRGDEYKMQRDGPFYSPVLDSCIVQENRDATARPDGLCNRCLTARVYRPDGRLRELSRHCDISQLYNRIGVPKIDEYNRYCVRGGRERVVVEEPGEGTAVMDCCFTKDCNAKWTVEAAEKETNWTLISGADGGVRHLAVLALPAILLILISL